MKNFKKIGVGLGLVMATALVAGCTEADAADVVAYEPAVVETVIEEPDVDVEEVAEDADESEPEHLDFVSFDAVEMFQLSLLINGDMYFDDVTSILGNPTEEHRDGDHIVMAEWGGGWIDGLTNPSIGLSFNSPDFNNGAAWLLSFSAGFPHDLGEIIDLERHEQLSYGMTVEDVLYIMDSIPSRSLMNYNFDEFELNWIDGRRSVSVIFRRGLVESVEFVNEHRGGASASPGN